MTTLRREVRQILSNHLPDSFDALIIDQMADEILKLRAFSIEEKKEEMRRKLESKSLEAAILGGGQVTQEKIDDAKLVKEAQDTFEQHMLFNPLPWNSTIEWEKLSKFVVAEYKKDTTIFAKYKTWQQNEGKYEALKNGRIRKNPKDFIDCFPDFLAHAHMYGKVEVLNEDSGEDKEIYI